MTTCFFKYYDPQRQNLSLALISHTDTVSSVFRGAEASTERHARHRQTRADARPSLTSFLPDDRLKLAELMNVVALPQGYAGTSAMSSSVVGKAIIILNPAEPQLMMRDTVSGGTCLATCVGMRREVDVCLAPGFERHDHRFNASSPCGEAVFHLRWHFRIDLSSDQTIRFQLA